MVSKEEALAQLEKFEKPWENLIDFDPNSLKVIVTPSGFVQFDDYMLFKKGDCELILLGARPSMGKSALMVQLGLEATQHGPVLFYSLEMSTKSIRSRVVAAHLQKSLAAIQQGRVAISDIKRGQTELPKNFYLIEKADMTVHAIRDSARNFAREIGPPALILVDYIQIVKCREEKNRSRNDEVGSVSSNLKAMAKELNCPVLVGSQLNRKNEDRGSREGGSFTPMLSDLKDSGSLEQDADYVVFLHRQEVYDGSREGIADISIAKNRNGKVGDFTLNFNGSLTKFFERPL